MSIPTGRIPRRLRAGAVRESSSGDQSHAARRPAVPRHRVHPRVGRGRRYDRARRGPARPRDRPRRPGAR
ncbi:conserved hypothetical protein [Micrococcus luteus]|nr:conserved hypothetical protein [Micrococcus luteus]